MTYLNPLYYDDGLNTLDADVNALHICTAEPTTYAEATATYSMGHKTPPSIAAPTDKAGGGREVIVSAFTDGVVTADGTPTYAALVDTVNLRLWAVEPLTGTEAMLNGDTFSLNQFPIGTPAPA